MFYPVSVKHVQRMIVARDGGRGGVKAVGNDNGSSDTATAALIYARYAGFDDKKASRFAVAAAVLNTESMEAVHESLDADLVLSYMEKIHERA